MPHKNPPLAKITRPRIGEVYRRERLFSQLDAGRDRPVVWVAGPPGSGKTTLVASYLTTRGIPYLWYQVDKGDTDIATFFYYMGMAAKKAFSKKSRPLPLLTPEYLPDVPSFTRRYFEELCGKLKQPFIMVFDNYQDVPAESGFHGLMNTGLSVIPQGIQALVVSRHEPAPAFSRLRANNGMLYLGWDDLKLTLEESREIAGMRTQSPLTHQTIADMHKKADGWAAGLALMMEIARTKGVVSSLKELAPQEIFDYFANEVFQNTEKRTQTFFLKTSSLPRMTAPMAEKLTGLRESEEILSALNKQHFFIVQYGYHEQRAAGSRGGHPPRDSGRVAYQYHPLFREFLSSQSRRLHSPEEFSLIQRRAAEVLEEEGMAEAAAALYRECGDWDGLAKLILSQAQSLAAEGRNKTLEEWLQSLPRDMLENTPWLLYWYGVCRMPCNPTESRNYFDRAFERFRSQGEQTGMWLSWSYAVDIIFYAWEDVSPLDKYAKIFQDIYREETPFPSPLIESRVVSCRFIIMMLRQMDHPDISAWAERVCALAQKSHDANFRLQIGYYPAVYYYWTGDFVKMHFVCNALHKDMESEAVSPLLSIFGMAAEALYYFAAGSTDLCLRIVSDGLKLAQKTGVHIWDTHLCGHGAFAALSAGDLTTASDLIGKIEPALRTAREIDIGYYYLLSSWKSLLEGDMPSAAQRAEIATSAWVAIGTPFPIALSHFFEALALFELGKTGEAEARLNLARQIGLQIKSKHLEFMCLIADAQFASDCGWRAADLTGSDKHSAMVKLRMAMEFGREQGYVNMIGWRYDVMSRLCVKALDAGIEVEYARSLVRKRNLIPDVPPIQCEYWPWPIKIVTLGRFVILHGDKPLQSAGKVQHKPLEMLRVILSNKDGEASEAQLLDVLWPDTEGDAAYRSYEAALHRLRRLLGDDEAVRRRGRQVSLNKRYCWVDAWAFERIVEPVVKRTQQPAATAEAARAAGKAINIYQGHFLPEDAGREWAAAARLRLQNKFRNVAALLGVHLE